MTLRCGRNVTIAGWGARCLYPALGWTFPLRTEKESEMCLTCGCMDAHKVMGDNLTYEDLKRMADGNGNNVDDTLEIVARTAEIDRRQHQMEYTGTGAPAASQR